MFVRANTVPKTRHGEADFQRTGLFQVVQRDCSGGRPRPAQRCEGVYGHQALRFRDLGAHERGVGRQVQGHRSRERLLPAVHPEELPQQGSGTRRRVCQGVRGGDPLPAQERPRRRRGDCGPGGQVGRGTHRAPHLGDHHLEDLQDLDSELPRPSAIGEPMGQCGPMGDAHTPLPPHH